MGEVSCVGICERDGGGEAESDGRELHRSDVGFRSHSIWQDRLGYVNALRL